MGEQVVSDSRWIIIIWCLHADPVERGEQSTYSQPSARCRFKNNHWGEDDVFTMSPCCCIYDKHISLCNMSIHLLYIYTSLQMMEKEKCLFTSRCSISLMTCSIIQLYTNDNKVCFLTIRNSFDKGPFLVVIEQYKDIYVKINNK